MKSTVGVYDTHDKAIAAIIELKKAGFNESNISVIGQAEVVDDHLHVKSKEGEKAVPLAVGVVLGPIIGVLSGIGLVAIPGLGVLYGAGALAGALAGLDIGLIGGGVVSLLTMFGIKHDNVLKYKEHLAKGHFLVTVQGTEDEINTAHKILVAHDEHLDLEVHSADKKKVS